MKWEDIQVEHNKQTIKARKVEIEYKGAQAEVIIRRMGFIEKNSFMSKYVQMQVVGDSLRGTIMPFEMKNGALLKCILKAPFPITVAGLDDPDIGDMLEDIYSLVQDYNKLNDETKKKLEQLSEEAKQKTEK